MNSPFYLTQNDLSQLGPDLAVDIFRELLWAEANKSGVAINLINVPSAITVSDGGIDADVQADISSEQGLIKKGLTSYQIKAGDFTLNPYGIKEILFVHGKEELKPRVKACLDNGGTLVVVFFKWDNPDKTDDECRQKFIEVLKGIDQKYEAVKIEVWRQNTLRGYFRPYVSLTLRVKQLDKVHYQTHRSWSRQGDMMVEPKLGDKQNKLINTIRDVLRSSNGPVNIRVDGEAGIGKTKMVLEATRTNDLAPLVIYCSTARKFIESDLMNEILKEDNEFRIILVVDECDRESRASIWNKVESYTDRIQLITMYNESDKASYSAYIEVPPLDNEQVKNILQSEPYGIPEDQTGRWVEYCGGSPRVAHAVGHNLKNNPDDLLKSPANVNIWDRFIIGGDDPNSIPVRQRHRILRYLSLYKKFGYSQPYENEAHAIAAAIQKADPQITLPIFREIIEELRKRRILQGETTLYITPKLLHIRLWIEWWETYGGMYEYLAILSDQSKLLQSWSHEMFVYAQTSPVASKAAKDLLGEGGPFLK